MAIIVEDGTIVTSANSYVTVAEVDTYCENRGLTSWASSGEDSKEQALLRGMDYIETLPFKGEKTDFDNALVWPRVNWYTPTNASAYDITDYESTIPAGLKSAVCRAAYEENASSGCLQTSVTRDQYITRKKIDVIEIEYSEKGASVVTTYPQINGHLKDLLQDSSVVKVTRT